MARHRRSYRSRPEMNMTWQPFYLRHDENVTANAGEQVDFVLGGLTPGVGRSDGSKDEFENDHVLERIRGAMTHVGRASLNPSGSLWFPFSLAFLRIPAGFTGNAIDLFDNSKGDDFVMRHDTVCRASNSEAVPNWHNLDSKAKRRFSVGDKILVIGSLISPTNTDFTLEICFNVRMLWKLT